MIKITELEKIYRTDEVETVALNKLSLEVKPGEFVATHRGRESAAGRDGFAGALAAGA